MSTVFPLSPSDGDMFISGGTRYIYDSVGGYWEIDTSVPSKAPTTHVFTSSVSSWTIPANARAVHAVVVGGGGGGGGGNWSSPGGGGGGGGGISSHTYNLVSGYTTTAVITVGAGGIRGDGGGINFLSEIVLGTAGGTGGTSSIKFATSGNLGTLTASGGSGGATTLGGTSAVSGGAGGTGMWSGGTGGAGGSGTTQASNNGGNAVATANQASPAGGGGGAGSYLVSTLPTVENQGDGGAGGAVTTFGVAIGTAISRTDANRFILGAGSVANFTNTYYPANTPSSVFAPSGGGNGGIPFGFNGGNAGLYGGGGGGGGAHPYDYSGDNAFGGSGGSGAQGFVFITVWYE